MSRSVSVLRTSIVDSGLGMDVLRIVLGQGTELGDRWAGSVSAGSSRSGISAAAGGGTPPSSSQHGKGREKDADGLAHGLRGTPLWLGDDRRVIAAALSAVCNIVNDFSPLRPVRWIPLVCIPLGAESSFLCDGDLDIPRRKVNAATSGHHPRVTGCAAAPERTLGRQEPRSQDQH